jgi:DNA-binding transcriptional LysR family regulator
MLHQKIGQVHVAFEANSNRAVRHAVVAGGGIGCLSKTMVQEDLDSGRLCRLDIVDFAFDRPLSLARPKNIWRSQLTQAFDQFLLDRSDRVDA